MSRLRQVLADYLAVRRALGYKLARAAKLLDQYLAYVESRHEEHLRLETMLAWATLPTGADRYWAAYRLSIVRRFAVHVHAIDPTTEVPAADVLPWRHARATPYLYTDHELRALSAAAGTLRTPHRTATFRTLLGLLAVTGMRVGEALALDPWRYRCHRSRADDPLDQVWQVARSAGPSEHRRRAAGLRGTP